MVRSIGKRLGQLALITFVLYGVTLGPLFLRGMQYVHLNADNWRLLPYIVPAARYEQMVQSFEWTRDDVSQSKRGWVAITCYDAQNRAIRTIQADGDFSSLPVYSISVYEGNVEIVYDANGTGWRITTDALGRDIRYDYDDGSYAVMEYEGDSEAYSLSLSYDAQGTLTNRYIRTWDGNTKYIRNEDGAGNPQYEILSTLDGRGNAVSTQSIRWREGVPETDTEQYIWEYDDAEGAVTCISEDGKTDRIWYDEQGRPIRQEITFSDGSRHLNTIVYTDITRR